MITRFHAKTLHPLLFTGALGYDSPMRVLLHHPRREVEIKGPRRIGEVLKDMLNRLEEAIPGTKQKFYFEFLKRHRPDIPELDARLKDCTRCGQPTTSEICSHCKLVETLSVARIGPLVETGR